MFHLVRDALSVRYPADRFDVYTLDVAEVVTRAPAEPPVRVPKPRTGRFTRVSGAARVIARDRGTH
jgi:hypothetical protein